MTPYRKAVVAIFAVTLAYLAMNTKASFHFHESSQFLNYNMLAEAVMSGQFHLKQPVNKDRLERDDPRDPSLPYPIITDAIVLDGRYYFNAGPLPALLHAGWIWLTARPLPTGLAIIVSCVGTFLLMGLIFQRIRVQHFSDVPEFVGWLTLGLFGFSGPQLYMISRPVVYHEPIALGMLLVLVATLVIVWKPGFPEDAARLFWTGCLLGAAVACRANLIVYPICLCILIARNWCRFNRRRLAKLSAFFLVPIIGWILLLGAYNYVRFSNPLDFGRAYIALPDAESYQYCSKGGNEFRLSHVPINVYNYLLGLPIISHKRCIPLPFYGTSTVREFFGYIHVVKEQVGSIFLILPAILLVFLIPPQKADVYPNGEFRTAILFCLLSSAFSFGLLTAYYRAAPRYMYEFTVLLFIPLFCNVMTFYKWTGQDRNKRRAFVAGLVTTLLLNTLAGIHFGLHGMLIPR